jgi:hypothetical protein
VTIARTGHHGAGLSPWSSAGDDGAVIGFVITSPLSLARVLWWYGEDALWPRALELTPAEVGRLAPAFARLRNDPRLVARTWPSAPADAYLLLPTIGLLEGASARLPDDTGGRPC